jgi:hypothetical protein
VGLFVKYLDECAPDDLSLLLRVSYPGQRSQETLFGIDANNAHAEVLGERTHHLVAFTETEQSMIDEYTHELVTDRAMQERRNDRGVHSAGEAQKDFALADLRTNTIDCIFNDVANAP